MRYADCDIENTLQSMLIGDEMISGMVGENVCPVFAQREIDGDAIYYESYGLKSHSSKTGIHGYEMNLVYGVVSERFENAQSLFTQIIKVLEGEYENPWMKVTVVYSKTERIDLKFMKAVEFLVEW